MPSVFSQKYSVAAVDCDILKHAQSFSLLHSITLESLDMIYTYGTRLKFCVHYNSIKLFSSDSKSNGNIYSRKRFRMWSKYFVAKLLLYFNTSSAMPSWVYCEYHCMQHDCYEGLFFFWLRILFMAANTIAEYEEALYRCLHFFLHYTFLSRVTDKHISYILIMRLSSKMETSFLSLRWGKMQGEGNLVHKYKQK